MQQDQHQPLPTMAPIHLFRDNAHFNLFASRRLTWWEEIGIGFYPVETGIEPYNDAYFDRYVEQANTPIGRMLMASRVKWVNLHINPWDLCVDVGIGSGAFIEERNKIVPEGFGRSTFGYDICPKAIDWLLERKLYYNIESSIARPLYAASFWDVLEHMPNPAPVLSRLSWAFISIPLFNDAAHVLRSKHYRKDEHIWYFTARGLCWYMDQLGFNCVTRNGMETAIGREDIGTFAFKRRSKERVHRT